MLFFEISKYSYFIFELGGLVCVGYGIFRFIRDCKKEEDYWFELNIKNILEQDLTFLELKLKELEYNEKVNDYNNKYNTNLNSIKWRDMKSIVKQARTPDFYEKTYGKYS